MDNVSEDRYNRFVLRWPFFRDVVLFVGGFSGTAYLVLTGSNQLTWIPVFVGMMGLPAFTRRDEKKQDSE